ncbi:FadR/GntR family transcriptional regulator [Nonomuraea sp. NPDC049480]|uniref:FadR/GntR family transcriptional regulator n=1 Tax=Nonomuraea sp. NPDC049480 TaxID=3364353 RepID=UPI0037AF29D5
MRDETGETAETGSGSVLRPVRLPTAAEEVADRLITAVAIGEYLPGERLPPERELAQILGVSRSTIREAVGRLLAVGVVDIRRGRNGGAYVRETWTSASADAVRRTLLPRWAEMEQLFDLRCLVEGMVARVAAERREPADVARMREALDRYGSARSPHEEHAADIAFHQAVVEATRNPQIARLSRDLLSRVSLGFPIEPYDGASAVYERALAEHSALCDAIAAGDTQRAGEIAQGHFSITNEALREVLARSLGDDRP